MGLVLGVFPIAGCPTVLCLIAASRLRLNLPALQLLNGMSSPAQLALLLPLARAGAWLCGGWGELATSRSGWLGAAAAHAVAGWVCLCVPCGAVLYVVLLHTMRRLGPVWSNSAKSPA